MLALDLQLSRLNDIIHFRTNARILPRRDPQMARKISRKLSTSC
jgi:hypothetical protein